MKRAFAPLGIFAAALAARAAMAATLRFPVPEDSAYYVAAARNLAEGRGFVVDVLWSYATPPLTLPRPAFDLWQPLASLVAAPFMAVFGPSLASAQASSVLLGALAAPLAWAIGRDAAAELRLPPARVASVALAAGLAVGLTPLLVVQGAEPDSSAPFTVLTLAACWLMPRALAERPPARRMRLLLGLALGLSYLARQEGIYLGVAYVVLAWLGDRRGGLARAALPLGTAALLVAPWLVRQAVTWQGSTLGQLLENAWLVRNEDIFAWAHRPTLQSHLALGVPRLVGMRLEATLDNTVTLLVTGFPAVPIGLGALALRRRLVTGSALGALAIYAILAFLVSSFAFPVASRWGLFAHAAGPSLALAAVLAALAADTVAARLATVRGWRRQSVALAGASIAILTLPLTIDAAQLEAARSASLEARYRELGAVAPGSPIGAGPLISDHPLWASFALRVQALALPREEAQSVIELAERFGGHAVLIEAGSDWPPAGSGSSACLREIPAAPHFRAFRIECPAAPP